jgi:hypothetical protein
LHKVGSPILENSEKDYTKVPVHFDKAYPVAFDVEYFQAVQYVYGLFNAGIVRCSLYEWCVNSGMAVDNNCLVNPPLRADETIYDALCPVGALWKHWDLKRYRLKQAKLFKPICK